MSRLDAHIHLFEHGFSTLTDAGEELALYETLRHAHGIERALVVGFEGESRYEGNNQYILALSHALPWVKPLAFIDLASPLTAEAAWTWLADGGVGFALYPQGDPAALDALDAALLDVIAESGCPLSLNVRPEGMPRVRRLIDRVGDCPVLVSHLGLPGPAASIDRVTPLLELASAPQVVVKLSGLYAIEGTFPHPGARDAAFAALESFGADRMLWGSDFAPGLDELSAGELFSLPEWMLDRLSPTDLELVMGGSLARILEGR